MNGSVTGITSTVVFNEDIKTISTPASVATDFVVSNKDGVLTPVSDYTVANGDSNEVIITFTTARTGIMKVSIANPRFLVDENGNVVSSMEAMEVDVDNVAPTATIPTTTGSTNNGVALDVTFTEELYVSATKVVNGADLKANFEVKGTATITSAIYDLAAKKVTFVIAGAVTGDTKAKVGAFTDLDGNVYGQETMTYNTTGTIWTK